MSHLEEPNDAWYALFGAKETVISVLSKLVAMQKTLIELQEKEREQGDVGDTKPMSQEDWELLALCVDRWRERQRLSELT